jgi:hypothetical protein
MSARISSRKLMLLRILPFLMACRIFNGMKVRIDRAGQALQRRRLGFHGHFTQALRWHQKASRIQASADSTRSDWGPAAANAS